MEKNIMKLVMILISWVGWVSSVVADPLVINDLIAKSKVFDGKQVTIEAEVIGDIMKRGQYTWINVTDGSAAIGVYIESTQIEAIKMTGGYKQKGDTVSITGIFHRVYDDQGGEMAIEGESLQVIDQGVKTKEQIPSGKLKMLGSIMLLAVSIMLARKYARKKGVYC